MSSYVRAPRQLPDAGGYPSLFTAPSASPLCSRVSSARFLVRLLLALIYYSAGRGRFINRLSLRIKPLLTRVGGRRTRRAARALISPPPGPPLFFLFPHPSAAPSFAFSRFPLAFSRGRDRSGRLSRSSRDTPELYDACAPSPQLPPLASLSSR